MAKKKLSKPKRLKRKVEKSKPPKPQALKKDLKRFINKGGWKMDNLKNSSSKNIQIIKTKGEKISGVFLEYGETFLENCETNQDYEKSIALLVTCWNLGILPKEELSEAIKKLVGSFINSGFNDQELLELTVLVGQLVLRKKESYGKYRNMIIDYRIDFNKFGTPYIEVMTVIK